jgi:3-dehydroquinate synthase
MKNCLSMDVSTPRSSTTTVRVSLDDRSYEILIGDDLMEQVPARIQAILPKSRHAALIYDERLSRVSEQLAAALAAAGLRCSPLAVPSGENSKSIEMAARLWSELIEHQTDRGSLVIALGGGVVGDLAGFVAATFARGLPFVALPTTLLSQVDSSVGGKTGINLPQAKNMVGAFWQPSLVVIDMHTLDTLPPREFRSGLAEVVKYGVILQPELFGYVQRNAQAILDRQPSVLQHIIAESCRAKASIVQQDEREITGLRAILNYGHTFAHAIETVAGYGKFLHGEAVAIGMQMAAQLACSLGRVDAAFVKQQQMLLEALYLPTCCAEEPEQLWQAMQRDKKVEHGQLRFILPERLGLVSLVPGITRQQAIAAMESACKPT